jgi:hypothetical protein
MARAGHRILDADTHIIEPVEPIEAYLTTVNRAKPAALGPLIQRASAKAGMSRNRIGKRPALNRRLGSRERVAPPSAAARGAKDGGTPWAERWSCIPPKVNNMLDKRYETFRVFAPNTWAVGAPAERAS